MPVSAGGGLTGPGSDARLLQAARRGLELAVSPQGPLGLAVSGGSDSLAMLHLMAEAAGPAGRALQVVTVDHGLRPEAAEEAAAEKKPTKRAPAKKAEGDEAEKKPKKPAAPRKKKSEPEDGAAEPPADGE